MGEKKEAPERKKKGCMGRMLVFFVFAGLAGIGAALYFISQPQDISDIDGRGPLAVGKRAPNLKLRLKNAVKDGSVVRLSEEDLNLYLRDTLLAKQGGMLADHVEIKDVAIRMEGDTAEIILVREIAGHPFTVSIFLRVRQTEQTNGDIRTEFMMNGGPYHESLKRPMMGGRFGKLTVPEGFLILVLPAFRNLAAVYSEDEWVGAEPVKEIDFIGQMTRVSIEDGMLVLDPSPNMVTLPFGG